MGSVTNGAATAKRAEKAPDMAKEKGATTAALRQVENTRSKGAASGDAAAAGATAAAGAGGTSEASGRETTPAKMRHQTNWMTYMGMAVLLAITKFTMPDDLQPAKPTLLHVWYHGWVTALSTGLGALPLALTREPGRRMLGLSNAIACGMMLSASVSLCKEAWALEPDPLVSPGAITAISAPWRAALGALAGLLFIVGTKRVLEEHEDLHVAGLAGLDARKALLLVVVMTLHSFSEGVGIGVSFGGGGGAQLGVLISATLAVHNVPEGLAVALALHPRGVSRCNSALWCVLTSLPQPIMAVPAFLFVEAFLPLLPVGLGFAAGAMFWVAVVELLPDAVADSSWRAAGATATAAFFAMLWAHSLLDQASGG